MQLACQPCTYATKYINGQDVQNTVNATPHGLMHDRGSSADNAEPDSS